MFKKFWNWLLNKLLGKKLLSEEQFNNLILKQNDLFKKLDTNNDKYISLKELIDYIKDIITFKKG